MSIHLLECAARRPDLPPSTKLVLMCLADSASSQTRIAWPGFDEVLLWSGLSRSRASDVLTELIDAGLVARHKRGHRGRRAEFIVFPDGCCDAHPVPVDEPDDEDPFGSGGQDPLSVNGSGGQDPIGNGSGGPDPLTEKGSGLGPAGRTPSPSPTTNPQPPSGRCAHGRSSCRVCGTSPRAVAAAAARTAAEQRRLAEQARWRSEAAARPSVDPAVVEAAKAQARAGIRGAR